MAVTQLPRGKKPCKSRGQEKEGICGLCDTPADPERWQIDHVIPRSLGGTNDLKNLQVSHLACNRRKGNFI